MTTMTRLKAIGGAVLLSLLIVGVVAVVGKLTAFGDFVGDFFRSETYSATGPVVLHKLQAKNELVVAAGSFEVPVVICNGKPKVYGDRGNMRSLLEACNGFRDEKATVLVRAQVESVIDLSQVVADDVTVNGTSIRVHLPSPTLRRATVDAEDGVVIVDLKKSIWPGGLPDDYLASAAKAAKGSVSKVAEQSGLKELGASSTQGTFERLLESFGFDDVRVEVDDLPTN